MNVFSKDRIKNDPEKIKHQLWLKEEENKVLNSMLLSADYAQRQNELISQTSDKLVDIKDKTDALHKGVTQVGQAVEKVVEANEIIMDGTSNLSAISEEVAASTESVLVESDNSLNALENMNALLSEINSIADRMKEQTRK